MAWGAGPFKEARRGETDGMAFVWPGRAAGAMASVRLSPGPGDFIRWTHF